MTLTITTPVESVAPRRAAVITTSNGLVFNRDRRNRMGIPEWHHTGAIETPTSRQGGRAGVVVNATQHRKERYLTPTGYMWPGREADYSDGETLRRLLIDAFPLDVASPLAITTDRTYYIWVTPYDDFTIKWHALEGRLDFTLPLMAADPLKYGEPVSGTVGAYAGGSYFVNLPATATGYAVSLPGNALRFTTAEVGGAYAESATLTSTGHRTSRRVVAEVHGPLEAGDWWLVNETTGESVDVAVGLAAGQVLTLDSHAETADLNGFPVEELISGDWLSFAPGANTYRLMVGTSGNDTAHAIFTAYPADE